MTQEQRQLMECLRAYIINTPLNQTILLRKEQWESLYELAAVHKMTAVVYQALGKVPEFCREDPELKIRWRQDAICQIAAQTAKTRRILEIADALNEAQLPYAVVKGVICRQMYGRPDLRPSGDEDILIRPEDRQRCGVIFESLGLNLMQDMAEDEVSHWMDDKNALHIELHQALLPADWEMAEILNPYFSRHLITGSTVSVDGTSVRTLDPTAHLVFLAVHALKHFIAGGFGVRSLADVVMFAQIYTEEIDREQVRSVLTQIRGWVFFEQMLSIGEQYLGVSPEKLGWKRMAPRDFEPMLLDMLEAGVYGQTTLDRKHSATILVQRARGKKKSSVWEAVFPAAESLSGRYPMLKQKPGLLPLVWALRIGSYMGEILRSRGKESSPGQAVALGKQRQALMERYGIFPGRDNKK